MNLSRIIKTYSELIKFDSFVERFRYLKLNGSVGKDTFGYERYLNQIFYSSPEWKSLRHEIIIRDLGCDLGVEGHDIPNGSSIFIHHMNPLTKEDILSMSEYLTNPEYLICTSFRTHNAIHYGDENLLELPLIIRTKNDTCPWKRHKGGD